MSIRLRRMRNKRPKRDREAVLITTIAFVLILVWISFLNSVIS
jgi:predicted nucleic acid-binding Zn ribbon protein